ncbi:MAG: Uma2 family endonuclease [Cyanothece sp. SIO1E1]|nr:Uma2 family endonuclease [Cyanothece sp. SIO1E1]
MVQTSQKQVTYPESDGKPMADNTIQFRWISTIVWNLKAMFANEPNVFVAGDLFWYPVEGKPDIKAAPDSMVVFGRSQGDRGSYQQWNEDGIAPQVVFEILLPSNTLKENAKKFDFYLDYEVEEYYLYDPYNDDLAIWLRQGAKLEVVEQVDGFISPRLNIRFQLEPGPLKIYRPDGTVFLTPQETEERAVKAEARASRAENRANLLADKLKELGIDPDSV